MISRRFLYCASAVAVLVVMPMAGVVVTSQAGQSSGNARFVEIENIEGFSGFFNIGQGTVRIVSLMSPSCPECKSGFYEVKRIMEAIPNRRLRAYIVFMPVDEKDTRAIALTLLSNLNDRRVSYFWDPTFAVGTAFKSFAVAEGPVRDTHFLFNTDAVVRETPTTPFLWMRQHAHGDDPVMDGKILESQVQELLTRFENEQRARRDAPADTTSQ